MSRISKAVKSDADDFIINEYLDYQLYGEESKVAIKAKAAFKKQAKMEYELIYGTADWHGPQKIINSIAELCTLANKTQIMQRRLQACRE